MISMVQSGQSLRFGLGMPILAGVLAGAAALVGPNAWAAPTTFWVSPSGSDAAPGSQSAPFKTLERAVEAVRSVGTGDITVYVADGTYRLATTLVFDAQHFGVGGPSVELRAADGAHPVISGSVNVTGWTLHDKALRIYRADVGRHESRQLFVNGRRATRARTNAAGGAYPAGFRPSPVLPKSPDATPYTITGGIEFIPTRLNDAGWRDPAAWRQPRDVEAVIETQWKMMSVPLAGVTRSDGKKPGRIELRQPAWTNANLYFSTVNKSGVTTGESCQPDGPGIWSFWQVTRFENAYEFLDQPGEWYLDRQAGVLYYIPRRGEDLATAEVELPVLETLLQGVGTPDNPVSNLRFEGLTFAYATWLGPGHDDGYVSDQSGFRVVGSNQRPNVIGHVRDVSRTPGNLSFAYARHITFSRNRFSHLGAVALDFGSGSQDNTIAGNMFFDISAAAVQVGGVSPLDARPRSAGEATRGNTISNNVILQTGREFVDSAAVFVGFSSRTEVSHNTISHVPWSGIAIGWGWGLLDAGTFPGVPCATKGMWGAHTTPTVNSRNAIRNNRISHFLESRWDGGAVYSTGQQGQSMDDPLVIEGNVADHRAGHGGGNTFYTDGGSRYVVLRGNVSYDNPLGHVDLGPLPRIGDPLPYPLWGLLNVIPYGSDIGGCRTYGDIRYEGNYWMAGLIPIEEWAVGGLEELASAVLRIKPPFNPYTHEGFFNICPYSEDGVSYPTRLTYVGNHDLVLGEWEVPRAILHAAGARP